MTESELFLKEWEMSLDTMIDGDHFTRIRRSLEEVEIRNLHIKKFGFAVLTSAAIEELRPYAPFVEVGCGSGYWAYELRKAGIEIVATEPHPGVKGKYRGAEWTMWTHFEQMIGTIAVTTYPAHTLLTVWPDYNTKWPVRTLDAFTGDVVVYVGEGHGGCTGNDEFHDVLDSSYTLEKEVAIPKFFGMHDEMRIYRRKR